MSDATLGRHSHGTDINNSQRNPAPACPGSLYLKVTSAGQTEGFSQSALLPVLSVQRHPSFCAHSVTEQCWNRCLSSVNIDAGQELIGSLFRSGKWSVMEQELREAEHKYNAHNACTVCISVCFPLKGRGVGGMIK